MLFDPNTALAPTFRIQDSQDVNGDGTIDIATTVSWLPVSGTVRYDVEVSRSDTSGGPWTVTGLGGTAPAGLETFTFRANTSKFYRARVRARNFAGAPGNWTTNCVVLTTSNPFSSYAGFQPVKKSTAPAAPSVVTMGTAASPLGFPLSWAQIDDPDYVRTDIALGTSSTVGPTDDSSIFASAVSRGYGATPQVWIFRPWAAGTGVYIWLRHVNASGQASSWVYGGHYVSPGITNAHLADDACDTRNYIDGSITVAKIADPTTLVAQGSSGLSVGGNGTYATMKNSSGGILNAGATTSGANLAYSDSAGTGGGSSPGSGTTWQAMCRVANGNTGMFLRVS